MKNEKKPSDKNATKRSDQIDSTAMAMAWICSLTKKVFTLIKVRRQSSTIYAHVRINSFFIAFSFNQMFFDSLSPVSFSPALALCLRIHLTIFMMNFNLMAPIAFA